MKGIQNLLQFLEVNWTSILVCVGIIIGLIQRTKSYFKQTNETKIEIAKQQIEEIVLKMITEAEIDFNEWEQSGSIKRSQVIAEIYEKYPILSKAKSQSEVIEFIDTQINNSLKELRKVLEENIKLKNIT